MSFKIEHRIGIAASPDIVWEMLTDLEGWSAWNPLYPKASGQIAIGAPLSVTLTLPDSPPEELKPRIVDWAPYLQLVWRLKLMGGLLNSVRYWEIESLDEGRGCIVSHGEIFDGLAASFLPKDLRRKIKHGFAAMSEALQAEAQRRAQSRTEGPPRLEA